MSVYEANECVDCGQPCLGSACPNRHVIHKECDVCVEDFDKVYKYGNMVLCPECLLVALEEDGVIKEAELEYDDVV